jgi:endonuclease-3
MRSVTAAARVRRILPALRRALPDARCALRHRNAFELLVATILSAQCTDERVNAVTPELFRAYPDAAALAKAPRARLEALIRRTGFFRAKARSLLGCARALVERHGGRVPQEMDALVALPGVGRKTANVVLGTAFGIASGVVVDTHVARLSRRMGLTRESDPLRIERDLMAAVPRRAWIEWSHLLIHHGRRTCRARKPDCAGCAVAQWCPREGVG